jgi:hypothetical protein
MSTPNGLPPLPSPQQEAVLYEEVLEYWQNLVMELHGKLSMAEARLRNRDREIQTLKMNRNGAQVGDIPVRVPQQEE